jgi:hypothetical protein
MAWTPAASASTMKSWGSRLCVRHRLPKLGGFFTSFMSGNTTRLGVGLASTSRSAGVRWLRIADTASAPHGGNDGFPQRPSQGGTKRLILTTRCRRGASDSRVLMAPRLPG